MFRRTPEQRREKALRSALPGPLRDYLAEPLPALSPTLDNARLRALDLETPGTYPRSPRVLSSGWLPIDDNRVVLGGAGRVEVRDDDAAGVGQSATVHGLTDDRLASGVPLEEAVGLLVTALTGRVLLAHFARIETDFLGAACQRLWGAELPCVVVDTFELERRELTGGRGGEVRARALRLWAARERRGLPPYRAHEALTDALACAELYLVQRAELVARCPGTALTLRHVVA